jgi:hypothetical protein
MIKGTVSLREAPILIMGAVRATLSALAVRMIVSFRLPRWRAVWPSLELEPEQFGWRSARTFELRSLTG